MEDFFQIILFIIFALFSLISSLLKKRKKQQAETRKPKEETEADTRRPRRRPEVSPLDEPEPRRRREQPATFEEILRELTGESPLERRAREEEEEDDYENPFAERKAKEAAEEAKQKMEEKANSFGKSVQQARGAQKISDKIDFEQDISSRRLEVKKVKVGKKKRGAAADIAKSLKDPQSARKAIILSEIIKPKYF
ncbi:MAG: hypothetical protein ACLFUB_16310 [Cyclobacteriaceae bacterium]